MSPRTQPIAVPFWSPEEIEASLSGTIAHLQAGGVLAYPTETVYGFGSAVDHDSVERLVRLKGGRARSRSCCSSSSSDMIARLDLHSRAPPRASRHDTGPVR